MTAAAFKSVALFVWTRHRFVIVVAVFLYAAALVAYSPLSSHERWALVSAIGTFLSAAPFVVPLVLFTSAVSVATTDLATRDSWYPRQFFTLPLTARQLALPFGAYLVGLYVLLWIVGVWISDARVLYAGPLQLPKEALLYQPWAPFLHLTLLVWTQALIWMPFRARWTRVALLFGLVAAYLATLIVTIEGALPGAAIVVLALVSIPAALSAGVRGIAGARAGDTPQAARARGRTRAAAAPVRFATALGAQAWYEKQVQRGRAGFVTVFVVPLVLLLLVLGMLAAPPAEDTSLAGMLAFRAANLLLWIFGIVGIGSGPAFATFRADLQWHADDAFRMPAFFAALPLSTGQFAWLKLATAARRMLRVGIVVLVTAAGISALTGTLDSWSAPLGSLRERFGALEAGGVVVLGALVFLLMVAAATANLVWLGLIGRRWHIVNFVIAITVVVAMVVSASIDDVVTFVAASPTVLPSLAAVKLAVLAGLAYVVGARGLYERNTIARLCACWVGAGIVAFLAYLRYAPEGAFDALAAASTLVIALPILGVLAAPLALQANRCR